MASAAYQSGEKLHSEFDHTTKSYAARSERIIYTEIMLPAHAPRAYLDRQTLWNAVEMNERQCDAQYARRFVMALPRELSEQDNLDFARQYCQEQFVSKGMCVDLAYHYDGDGNPHIHVLTTMRALDENGRWLPKSRKEYALDENDQRIRLPSGTWKSRKVPTTDWDNRGNLEKWRHEWEALQNQYLEDAGRPERIDMRSYERQANDLIPTVHLGPAASAMERQGERTFLGDMNREIRRHNALVKAVKDVIQKLHEWLDERRQRRDLWAYAPASPDPPIHSVLCDYFRERMKERASWHELARIQGTSKDIIRFKETERRLDEQGIFYTSDFARRIETLENKSDRAAMRIRENAVRRKTIDKIIEATETIARVKPVYDTYNGIFFTKQKERYRQEHEDELKDSKRAYAFLMRNHNGQLEVRPGEFKSELARMEQEDAEAHQTLQEIRDELSMLRRVKYMIDKVDEELVQNALHQDSHETQEQEAPVRKRVRSYEPER